MRSPVSDTCVGILELDSFFDNDTALLIACLVGTAGGLRGRGTCEFIAIGSSSELGCSDIAAVSSESIGLARVFGWTRVAVGRASSDTDRSSSGCRCDSVARLLNDGGSVARSWELESGVKVPSKVNYHKRYGLTNFTRVTLRSSFF